MRLALSIWKVDHDTLDIHNSKLLSIHIPSIYELGIQSLVENELYNKAIQCLALGNVTCPRLHLQALVHSGHVQKAFTILSMFEGSEEYQQLMENYVDYCLKSNFSNKLKQLQLNLEQLSHICSILKSHEREEAAIQLSLSLLLLHQCNIEAISLAREKGYQGGMLGHCLSFGSALLPPVKETMCSEELLEKIQSTTEAPVGPPMVLSSIMPKTNDHTFTSQIDIILAVTKKVAEARHIINDPITPLRKNTRLNDSIISSPGLSTMPFTSSPLSFARKQSRTLRQTPLIHSSTKQPMTPRNTNTLDRSDTRMKQFLADMEGFRTRMTTLSSHPRVDHDSIAIQTPRPIIILDQTPNTASILKPNIIDSTPIELTTSTSRRIRFKDDDDDDNNGTSLGRKPLSTCINTPLPLSDDSDSFYSPQSTTEPVDKRPDVDDLAANVVIATDHDKGLNESFIAAAEDEDDPIVIMDSSQLTKLGEICKSPSNIVESFTHKETDGGSHVTTSHVKTTYSHVITTDTQLTRSSINRNVTDNVGSFTQPKVVIPPLRLTPLVERDKFESKKVPRVFNKKRSTSRQPEKQIQKYSGVMVNAKQDDAVKYTFSPPPAVAMVTPAKDVTSSSSDFVFSPPLLRSANRGKKTAANTKTVSNEEECTEIDLPSSSRTHSSIRQSSQQKRVRQVRTTQSTPRRSERLLRSAKKI